MYLEDEMSTKAKESKMEAVRVVMTPLGLLNQTYSIVEYDRFPCV